jgi:enamine deaminase RidA (YjgF/YER057c/UK114 family)
MTKHSILTAFFLGLLSPLAWPDAEIQRLNPEGMYQPDGYRQVVTAEGGKIVYLAGQAGLGADGSMPETLAEQAELTYENIRRALAAVDGSPSDVVRITVYIVGLGQGIDPTPVYEAQGKFFPADAKPASTILGVSGLALPGLLVEVDVIALVDD